MQLDMHYYGTYAMARAAGMSIDAARVVATAAQFVDDNATQETIKMLDGARLDVEATAHHSADLKNIDLQDQRRIWVPFHFIPGNEGDSYEERLICRMDSVIAREMVAHNVSVQDQPYALELVGITAHVYADTFSHYGFSGISSKRNMVAHDSFMFFDLQAEIEQYIKDKAKGFFRHYRRENGHIFDFEHASTEPTTWDRLKEILLSMIAERFSGALGHASVATFPDRPYLNWSFEFDHPLRQREARSNPETYLQACRAMYDTFSRFLEQAPRHRSDGGRDFDVIEGLVAEILFTQAPLQGRVDAWQSAARSGSLFSAAEDIPAYSLAQWRKQRLDLASLQDSREVVGFDVYQFYQAASIHRNYVLRELLPAHGLVVQ